MRTLCSSVWHGTPKYNAAATHLPVALVVAHTRRARVQLIAGNLRLFSGAELCRRTSSVSHD
jgi:hypothetical protein